MIGRVVVVGGSAGAPRVLAAVLGALPTTFSAAICVVLHVHRDAIGATEMLAEFTGLPVLEAGDKATLQPGRVLVAPPDYHLLLERDGRLSLTVDALVRFSRPSIHVLFESAATALGSRVIGVLLSGANDDGTRGLLQIARAGGAALIQRPDTADQPRMPSSAAARLPSAFLGTPDELVAELIRLTSSR